VLAGQLCRWGGVGGTAAELGTAQGHDWDKEFREWKGQV